VYSVQHIYFLKKCSCFPQYCIKTENRLNPLLHKSGLAKPRGNPCGKVGGLRNTPTSRRTHSRIYIWPLASTYNTWTSSSSAGLCNRFAIMTKGLLFTRHFIIVLHDKQSQELHQTQFHRVS
jgi:hypothetical protein